MFERLKTARFIWSMGLILALFVATTALVVQAQKLPQGNTDPFFTFDGTLTTGQSIAPLIPLFGDDRHFNFSLTVTGAADLALDVANGSGDPIWSGIIQPGETLWGSGTLTEGNNVFTISNVGVGSSDFLLNVYDLPTVAYTWAGVANGSGLNSEARMNFPSSGLYTFDLNVGSGRYQLWVDEQMIQKTAENSTSVTYFVPAGVHTLRLDQDSDPGANWAITVSDVGAANDNLPYTQSGGEIGGVGNDFTDEWLPIQLSNATQINFVMTLTGTAGDHLNLEVVSGGVLAEATIYAGETRWVTVDLPVGTTLFHLAADAANADGLSYEIAVHALPNPSYSWTGTADAAGENSHARVNFETAGLYTFDFTVASGRYQFWVNDQFVQKTVESDGSVTYYIPAGIHDLYLDQDTSEGADWSVSISLESVADDSLPYHKSGGNLGGAGNDFSEEWLPISLASAATVNMRLEIAGAAADGLVVEVYEAGSDMPNFTLDNALGGEVLWANFPLSAGINRLHLIGNDNALELQYDLTLSPMSAADEDVNWAGNSRAAGLNSQFIIDFPTDGIYRFEVSADPGFVNLALEDFLPIDAGTEAIGNRYDRPVTAGTHVVYAIQDSNFPVSTWTATVTPITPTVPANFFTFEGDIASGDTITPEYPLIEAEMPFNFSLAVAGSGPVELEISNGATVIWTGTAEAGETLWGTGDLLNGLNLLQLSNLSAGTASVTLNLYEQPTVAYDWLGNADAVGLNSHIRANFAVDGLYTFDLNLSSGRYQFMLDEEYILKTAELDTSVTYFVPAGVHDLMLIQDSSMGADWHVQISSAGSSTDSLPYSKSGGNLGGLGNDFTEEWLPVHLSSAQQQLNLAVTLTGGAGDLAALAIYNPMGGMVITGTVLTGETTWFTMDLPAGTSLIHLMADAGNNAAWSYDLTLGNLPEPPYSWDGIAEPGGASSAIRVNFTTDSLYHFDLGVDTGRYQLWVDNQYIQKTAESDSAVTYFVPAGVHDLLLVPDEDQGADWDVTITNAGIPLDSLPYHKEGGNLGGTANEFTAEWLPLNLTGSGMVSVNLELQIMGDNDDYLVVEVWDSLTEATILTLDPVYGGETLWATVNLPTAAAGGSRLHIVADRENAGTLAYELTVHAVPTLNAADASYTLDGLSLDDGLNSELRLNSVISGVYLVQVYLPQGFAALYIDSEPTERYPTLPTDFFYEFEVPLNGAEHTFIVDQDPNFAMTQWVVTTTLLLADAPRIDSTDPITASAITETPVTITGFNFMVGATVELVRGNQRFELGNIDYVDAGTITAIVPEGLPLGIYDLIITNPDGQIATLTGSFAIEQELYYLYLPILTR